MSVEDIKRRAGINEDDEEAKRIMADAYRTIFAANQELRKVEGARGVAEARHHFGEGLDILMRGGSWR